MGVACADVERGFQRLARFLVMYPASEWLIKYEGRLKVGWSIDLELEYRFLRRVSVDLYLLLRNDCIF